MSNWLIWEAGVCHLYVPCRSSLICSCSSGHSRTFSFMASSGLASSRNCTKSSSSSSEFGSSSLASGLFLEFAMSSLDMLSHSLSYIATGDCLGKIKGTSNSGKGNGTGICGELSEDDTFESTREDGCGLRVIDSTQDSCGLDGVIDGGQDSCGLRVIDGVQDSHGLGAIDSVQDGCRLGVINSTQDDCGLDATDGAQDSCRLGAINGGQDGCGLGVIDSVQDGCGLGAIDSAQDGYGLGVIDGMQDGCRLSAINGT